MSLRPKEVEKLEELSSTRSSTSIYFAESKIVEVLPKMQEAASSSQLKSAFENHLGLAEIHVKRLEQVFDMFGKEPDRPARPS